MLPTELITLLGSSVTGGTMRMVSRWAEARQQERLYTLQALSAKADIIAEARKYENKGYSFTRRTIALTAVFFIIAFPKLVAVYMPDVPVHIGYDELKGGFLFFTDPRNKTIWHELRGLVITPLDTHLLSAIIGLYFGGSITR